MDLPCARSVRALRSALDRFALMFDARALSALVSRRGALSFEIIEVP
jgi:hypothetical protein